MSDPTSEWTCELMNERINKEAGIRSASRSDRGTFFRCRIVLRYPGAQLDLSPNLP